MTDTLLNALGTWVLFAAVAAGVIFLIAYTALARWWKSREGWYLFVSSFILTEILLYNYIAIQGAFRLTDPTVREWVRLAIYAQVLVVMLWRGILLLQAQFDRSLRETYGKDVTL